jgi:UDP-N-acetylglucosamine acyltransferase
MPEIHPTAIVDSRAELAGDVRVGPYVVIEGRVTIGPGTRVMAHTVIHGATKIGARCRIGPAAYVGLDPQHLGYDGGETWLVVGDDVIIRENASVHRSFKPGEENATRVGNKCFLMGSSHVGHDSQVADNVVLAQDVALGGHVTVGERAFLGGGAVFHQFVRIGRLAIVRGNEGISQDIPPFAAAAWHGLKGYNAIGCRRSGMSRESIHAIRDAYHCLHTHRTAAAGLAAIRALNSSAPEVNELIEFISSTKRGIPMSVRFLHPAGADEPDENA